MSTKKDRKKQWIINNRERVNEYQRNYTKRMSPEQAERRKVRRREYAARTKDANNARNRIWSKKRPLYHWERHLHYTFGITLEVYDSLLAEQLGVCAICEKPETAKRNDQVLRLTVDHCHNTGAIRGLLCRRCNSGIGFLNDDPALLTAAIGYLNA